MDVRGSWQWQLPRAIPLMSVITIGQRPRIGARGLLRVGIAGPVGAGKTSLVEALCKRLYDQHDIFVITNDIYTKDDQLILMRARALPAERIMGVETGGYPGT